VVGLTTEDDNLRRIFEQLKCGFEKEPPQLLANTLTKALRTRDYRDYKAPKNFDGRLDVAAFLRSQQSRVERACTGLAAKYLPTCRMESHHRLWRHQNLAPEQVSLKLYKETFPASPETVAAAARRLAEYHRQLLPEGAQGSAQNENNEQSTQQCAQGGHRLPTDHQGRRDTAIEAAAGANNTASSGEFFRLCSRMWLERNRELEPQRRRTAAVPPPAAEAGGFIEITLSEFDPASDSWKSTRVKVRRSCAFPRAGPQAESRTGAVVGPQQTDGTQRD